MQLCSRRTCPVDTLLPIRTDVIRLRKVHSMAACYDAERLTLEKLGCCGLVHMARSHQVPRNWTHCAARPGTWQCGVQAGEVPCSPPLGAYEPRASACNLLCVARC